MECQSNYHLYLKFLYPVIKKTFDNEHVTSIHQLNALQEPQQLQRRCHLKDLSINLREGNVQFILNIANKTAFGRERQRKQGQLS